MKKGKKKKKKKLNHPNAWKTKLPQIAFSHETLCPSHVAMTEIKRLRSFQKIEFLFENIRKFYITKNPVFSRCVQVIQRRTSG